MNSNESIISKIMNTAESQAEEILLSAKAKANNITAKASKTYEDSIHSAKAELKAESDSLIARRVTVANIDAKKIILQAKTEVLNEVFTAAGQKFSSVKDKEYLAYIESILRHGAEDGDTVIISANDSKRITSAFIKKVAESLKIKLTLSSEFGNFLGGVVLSKGNYDKNYTIESELKVLSENISSELSQLIFSAVE